MNRSRIDQFRRSQIYTPPPDYEVEELERDADKFRRWLPLSWLIYGALLFLAGFLAHGWMKP